MSPFFGAAISIPKKAVSPLMPSTPRKTVSETKGIFGTLEGRLRRFIDGDVVLKGGETRDASALFVIGVARFYNFGNTNGAHNFTNRHNGKVSISDHPDAHGGIDGEILHAREDLAVFYFLALAIRLAEDRRGRADLRPVLKPKLAIGIRHVRRVLRGLRSVQIDIARVLRVLHGFGLQWRSL